TPAGCGRAITTESTSTLISLHKRFFRAYFVQQLLNLGESPSPEQLARVERDGCNHLDRMQRPHPGPTHSEPRAARATFLSVRTESSVGARLRGESACDLPRARPAR